MKYKIATYEDYEQSGTQIEFNENEVTFSELDGMGEARASVIVPIAHTERMLEILTGLVPAMSKLTK